MGPIGRVVVSALVLVSASRAASACDGWGMPGAEYGAPFKWTGYAGFALNGCRNRITPGLRVALGQGGGKLELGAEKRGTDELGPRVSASVFLARTWGTTLHTAPGATYVGTEASVRIPWVARAGVGIARRVEGNPLARDFVVTWNVSVDVTGPFVGLLAILWRGPLIGPIAV